MRYLTELPSKVDPVEIVTIALVLFLIHATIQGLTNYKRPKHIEFIAEMPKTNVGKILRRELRKLAN